MDAKAVLDRIFNEVINNGNFGIVDELFTADFIDHGPMGDTHGPEQFAGLVAAWRDAVPDCHCVVENVVSDGVLAGWTVRTTGTHTGDGLGFPATGKSFETVSANVARFRDGKAAEHWAEQGIFPMLVQIGLMPMPVAP